MLDLRAVCCNQHCASNHSRWNCSINSCNVCDCSINACSIIDCSSRPKVYCTLPVPSVPLQRTARYAKAAFARVFSSETVCFRPAFLDACCTRKWYAKAAAAYPLKNLGGLLYVADEADAGVGPLVADSGNALSLESCHKSV